MNTTKEHDQRVAQLTFAVVYPHYVAKVERKGRSVAELHQVISWLTGYSSERILQIAASDQTFEEFFANASIHPNAASITGTICGYKIEEIETPLTRQARYMDKLVDELARGRKMEKILRES